MACPRYKKASVVVTILVVVIYLDKTLEQGGLRQNGLDLNGAHVCRVDIPITYTITTYYATTYMSGYTTCCGFLCWARCQRWREKTKQASKKLTRQGLDVYLRCCKGWQRSSSKPRECSEAICSQGCSNGGTCVYPEICSCASGWKGYSCSEDVDECRRNKGGCHHLCSNRVGKPPVCLCRRGYINSKTNYKRCVDIDECAVNSKLCTCADRYDTKCRASCGNTYGSFRCYCRRGYRVLGNSKCVDVNECFRGVCGQDKCVNAPGSYYCLCRRGFHKVNGKCQDVDECANSNGFCEQTRSSCENKPGSYSCLCKQGFLLDGNGRTCSDIDECRSFHGCQEKCINTVGDYHCTCSKGYRLEENNKTCTDIDECATENLTGTNDTVKLAHCQQLCTNIPGSYLCSCRDGFYLSYDKKHCTDIDECRTGKHLCDQRCHNTFGSYRCSCIAGYKLDADNRTCDGLPCEHITSPLHGTMTCNGFVTNSTCSFSCGPGYSLSGSQIRICQASSKWSGSRTICEARHCKRLEPKAPGHSLSLPCFTSFGSKCYFGCAPGYNMKGTGEASCSDVSNTGEVSWKIDEYTCKELKSCSQKPCKHGGKCKVQHQSFSCECEGTGYEGSECQKGFVTTPVFPKVSASSKTEALHLSARPSNKLTISLFAENGVTFYPSSYLEIVYPETKQKFFVESEKAGIQTISFDLGGPSVGDFEIPEPRFLLVKPRVMVNSSVYSKLFLPKGELPVGCNEYLSKSSSCELRFLSTEVWTGTSPSTKGIVHIKTPSNHYIPLSMVGLSLAELQLSKKSLSQAVSARMSFSDAQNDFHIIDGMCIQRGLTFENRLELINDDALVSSFLRTFSRMSPKWLHIVTEEENNVFDIQNIAVNVAKKVKLNEEHCSVFPLNPSSSIVYIRPTAKYQFWVSDVAVFLSAEGDTCFAADVCKQSVFIRFPKRSASEINDRLAAFRDMKERGIDIKVDSLGLLESFDTHDVKDGEIWNGMQFEKVSTFSYNMWLKGDVTWKMQTPANLEVKFHITGETFNHYEKIDDLFVYRLSRPLDMLLKGKVSAGIKGRSLGQDFKLELAAEDMIGKARLGGENSCEDRVQGVFLNFRTNMNRPFLKTPFYPYVRPVENQQLHFATLVKYSGGRQNRVSNKAEIRRTLTNLRFLVVQAEEIFQKSISMLPKDKVTIEKWIQTAAVLSGKIREFRRVLFLNRAIDIKKVRKLMADINEKIYAVRTSVGLLKHRVSIQASNSPLLAMIENFQSDFPHSVHLKLGGESIQQRLFGVKIYLRCSLCVKNLCLENINTVVTHLDGYGCGSKQFSGKNFYVSGKTPKVVSLSPSKILSLPEGQPITMVFGRESDQVTMTFTAWIQVLGLSQPANATLDNNQLSLKVTGKIFDKFPTEVNVVAKIRNSKDWNSLLYMIEGKMLKSSLLPSKLQSTINKYVLVLIENAQRRIKKAETANINAKRKTKDAEAILKVKQITLANASNILDEKTINLVEKRITYARRKIQFNSTLLRYLQFKNQDVCEMKECDSTDLHLTCIPDVCRKEVKTTYTIPICERVIESIPVVRLKKYTKKECYDVTTPKNFTKTGGGWIDDESYTTTGGDTREECFSNSKFKAENKTIKVDSYKCKNNADSIEVISGHEKPYACCNKAIKEKVQILKPDCVDHNSECWENITEFAQQLKRLHNKESALFADFQNMADMARQVNLAQMEVNLARTNVRMATNQVELALAMLEQSQNAQASLSISKIREQEKLGIRLADKVKSLDGKEMISVEGLSFSTSMTSNSKTLLPFVASVKDAEGHNKFVEFPIEFKRLDYYLDSAAKLVVQTLLTKTNSRERRSTHGVFMEDRIGMDSVRRICFFSHKANALFADVIDSLEFLVKSTNEYFEAISSGTEEVDSYSTISVKKTFSSTPQLQVTFSEMMQSLKDHFINITSATKWETILEQWRVHLNVLTGDKNLTECSGIEDCLEFFFYNLDDFYLFEYSQRALEIKESLQEMKRVFTSLLQRNSSFDSVKEIALRAKAVLNKTKDDSVLCGNSPVILKSSPAEVVFLTGETLNLTCLVTNSDEVEIVWIRNERVVEDKHDEVLVLRNADRQTEGAYKCKASNNRGVTVSNVTIVRVHEAPRITIHPSDFRVLVGTETLTMICSGDGAPKPTIEWFFMSRTGNIVKANSSDRLLTKKNLTSQDSGFYYCNVSNIRGSTRSRMARLDVLGFIPGLPRIAVFLKFARCAFDNFPYNTSNCTNHHYTPALQLDYAGVHSFFREITGKMRWAWGQIERLDFSPQSDVSLSFVITANESNVSSYISSDLIAALNSFSISRYKLASDLRSFRAALEERKFHFLWKNELIVSKNGGFAAELVTQKCPAGKEADENGFLCVNCALGYYGMSNGSCVPCPVGTYQSNQGNTECIKCPYIRSQTDLGAVLESQCIDISIPCNISNVTIKHAQVPENGKTRYRTGEKFVLGCQIGYKSVGNGSRECNEGNWTTQEFYCEKTCFPPWTEFKKRCYLVKDVLSYRWKDAYAACRSLNGSQMITIFSEEENDFAANLAKAHVKEKKMTQVQLWLGLTKENAQSPFQWVDGRTLYGSYTNWSPGEPNNSYGRERCTEMLISGMYGTHKWNDIRCDTTGFKAITICEKPLRAGE